MRNEIIFFLLGTAASAYGVLAILDAELAFKLSHPFQVRNVKLTGFGRDSAVLGGVLSIVVGWLIVGAMLSLVHAVLSLVVATVPLLCLYRDELRTESQETEP